VEEKVSAASDQLAWGACLADEVSHASFSLPLFAAAASKNLCDRNEIDVLIRTMNRVLQSYL
jgi:hypothetical protein